MGDNSDGRPFCSAQAFSEDAFEASKKALKKFLCDYFSSGDCNRSQGNAICPVGATASGGKILKVRWASWQW